jgi:hypothetical protein
VNYRQLPEAVFEDIARHFGIAFSAEEREQMLELARFDAKRPWSEYCSDSEEKQTSATARLRELAGERLAPAYARLEKARSLR